MTDLVTCPKCRDQLDVPVEFRGQPVKCATCQTVFSVPHGPSAEPPVARPSRSGSRGRPRDRSDDDPRSAKRSNGVVWFLLFGTALVCGAIGFGCAGLANWAYNPTMQVHKSEEGRFQVEFPEASHPFSQAGDKVPKPLSQVADNGAPVKGIEVRLDMNEARYFVKYYDQSKKQAAQEPEAMLADAVKAEIAAVAGGVEAARSVTTHAGHPAIDVQIDQGSQFAKRVTILRVMLAGSRIYVLGTQGQNQLPQLWYVQRFFISFRPDEKAKPAKKPEE